MFQVIVPCGANESIICGKASKWESNGTAFCDAMGFAVQTADDSVEEPCYGSKSSLEPVVESLMKTENFAWFKDVQKLVREMTLVRKMSWVVPVFVPGRRVFFRIGLVFYRSCLSLSLSLIPHHSVPF